MNFYHKCPHCCKTFRDGPISEQYRTKWKKWFAWYPIKIDNKWIWWCWVERQAWGTQVISPDCFGTTHYNYRWPQYRNEK